MIKNISDLKRDDMFFLLAGPCVIEGEDMALRIAERVVKITDKLHIPYVFKVSRFKSLKLFVKPVKVNPSLFALIASHIA